MPKLTSVFAFTVVGFVMAGCSSEPTCDYSEAPYMAAQSVPPLRAPDGLAAPDRAASLTIPPAGPNAKPVPTGKGRCLDRPPSYFSSSSDQSKDADKKAADKKK